MKKREARISRFIGNRYFFEIESIPLTRGFSFAITAIDPNSGRYSHVNNLNGIMSEFNVNVDDSRYQDSSWWIETKRVQRFHNRAEGMLRDVFQLRQIESTLDEDRWQGEWSNIRKPWNSKKWLRDYKTDTGHANGKGNPR